MKRKQQRSGGRPTPKTCCPGHRASRKQYSIALCSPLLLLTLVACSRLTRLADVGLTVTRRPAFSVYACGGGIFALGVGQLDGEFVGVGGGGRAGWRRYHHRLIGLGPYAHEATAWGDEPPVRSHKGLLGWLLFRGGDAACRGPL